MSDVGNFLYWVCWVETWLIIGRVLLSWFPSVDYGHPAIRALCAVTDPVLRLFRPILPTMAGIDLSPILAIVVLRALGSAFDLLGHGLGPAQFAVYVLRELILALIAIAAIVVFLRVILGFFKADPFHPATRMVRDLSRPLIEPFMGLRGRSRSLDIPAAVALCAYVVAYIVAQRLFDEIFVRV